MCLKNESDRTAEGLGGGGVDVWPGGDSREQHEIQEISICLYLRTTFP